MTLASEKVQKSGYHHGDLEAALIAQARELVSLEGVEHISLRDVAAKVGVSPSAVYHHFPDKNSLLSAVGNAIFDDLAGEQEKAMRNFPGKSASAVKKRFRAVGMAYFSFAMENPHLFRLCFGPLCAGAHEDEKANNRAWQILVTGLDEMTAIGEISPKIRPNAEILVWSAVHGASMLALDGLLPKEAVYVLLDSIELTLKGPR